jgi:hypothetical protein
MQDNLKKSLKIVNYAGIAAVTLLLAGTIAFGIIPMRGSGTADIAATTDLRGSIDRLEQLRLANARAEVQLQDSQERLDQAEKHLASGPPDAAFNNELSAVAKKAGIRIENMPPVGEPKAEGAYKTVQVTIIGSGEWDSCYSFLNGLRTMNQIARLDSVVMNIEDKDGKARASNKVNCQITVKFSTFYMER